jgi:hypothetical protein
LFRQLFAALLCAPGSPQTLPSVLDHQGRHTPPSGASTSGTTFTPSSPCSVCIPRSMFVAPRPFAGGDSTRDVSSFFVKSSAENKTPLLIESSCSCLSRACLCKRSVSLFEIRTASITASFARTREGVGLARVRHGTPVRAKRVLDVARKDFASHRHPLQ